MIACIAAACFLQPPRAAASLMPHACRCLLDWLPLLPASRGPCACAVGVAAKRCRASCVSRSRGAAPGSVGPLREARDALALRPRRLRRSGCESLSQMQPASAPSRRPERRDRRSQPASAHSCSSRDAAPGSSLCLSTRLLAQRGRRPPPSNPGYAARSCQGLPSIARELRQHASSALRGMCSAVTLALHCEERGQVHASSMRPKRSPSESSEARARSSSEEQRRPTCDEPLGRQLRAGNSGCRKGCNVGSPRRQGERRANVP
jgi:hypothetical protein